MKGKEKQRRSVDTAFDVQCEVGEGSGGNHSYVSWPWLSILRFLGLTARLGWNNWFWGPL